MHKIRCQCTFCRNTRHSHFATCQIWRFYSFMMINGLEFYGVLIFFRQHKALYTTSQQLHTHTFTHWHMLPYKVPSALQDLIESFTNTRTPMALQNIGNNLGLNVFRHANWCSWGLNQRYDVDRPARTLSHSRTNVVPKVMGTKTSHIKFTFKCICYYKSVQKYTLRGRWIC